MGVGTKYITFTEAIEDLQYHINRYANLNYRVDHTTALPKVDLLSAEQDYWGDLAMAAN